MTPQRFFLAIAVVFLFSAQKSYSQFSASFGPGVAAYSGDVSGERFEHMRPAFNLELWYQMHRHLYLKSGASIYQVFASDVFPERNRAFKATNFEVYTSLMLAGKPEWRLMPFAYAGIGVSTNAPQYAVPTDNGNTFIDARELNTENERIPGAFTIFPTGAGVRFRLNEKLAIVADAGLRFTNSDLIDGLTTPIIDVNNLDQEAINYFESIRPEGLNGATRFGNGNPDRKDVYGIFSVKLQFKLNRGGNGGSMPCPPFYRQ